MAISSPIWRVLADLFGRKSMVMRAMLGGGGDEDPVDEVYRFAASSTVRAIWSVSLSRNPALCRL